MTTAEWKEQQQRRCRKWIRGVQCDHDHGPDGLFCVLHGKGTYDIRRAFEAQRLELARIRNPKDAAPVEP